MSDERFDPWDPAHRFRAWLGSYRANIDESATAEGPEAALRKAYGYLEETIAEHAKTDPELTKWMAYTILARQIENLAENLPCRGGSVERLACAVWLTERFDGGEARVYSSHGVLRGGDQPDRVFVECGKQIGPFSIDLFVRYIDDSVPRTSRLAVFVSSEGGFKSNSDAFLATEEFLASKSIVSMELTFDEVDRDPFRCAKEVLERARAG